MFYVVHSPNSDVKSIIFFPILARGLFPKLLKKNLNVTSPAPGMIRPILLSSYFQPRTHVTQLTSDLTTVIVFPVDGTVIMIMTLAMAPSLHY